ncbi:hypothetical protein BH09BAC3_BH09BAC3_08350 [soil metagenome]
MKTPLYLITQLGFVILTFTIYTFLLTGLKKALAKTSWDERKKKSIYKHVVFSILGWTIFISSLSLSGFFQDFSSMPPRFVILLVVPMITIVIVTFSKSMKEIAPHIPASNVIKLQVFRVFVEILLWMLFLQNALPVQMTFEGRNFDVLSGLTALPAAYFLAKSRKGLIIWNLLSLGLLVNVVSIAILSLPTPFRIFENQLTIVAYFPFVWLPGLLVPLAYGLSFISLLQLREHTR